MLEGYIDRIEEGLAVILVQDGDYQLDWPIDLLPEGIGEGDYITLSMAKDVAKTEAALAEALALMED